MCGIAGKLTFDGEPVAPELLAAMTDVVAHRGPDAGGYYFGEGIGLGHRRLSIIDLSTGDQPLANEDETVWVVFNGEIYNFADVRAELEALRSPLPHANRHRESSSTATRSGAPTASSGSAACLPSRCGTLVRSDCCWSAIGSASSRSSTRRSPTASSSAPRSSRSSRTRTVPRDWRPDSLDTYLTFEYIPGPATIYRHVYKLPPGHLLIAERGRVDVRQYWDLEFTGDGDPAREAEYLHELDALLRESVRLRLISDVPLGAFLSGGIDSTTVVAYMVETSDAPVITTSVGFVEKAFDELAHAKTVADHLGCEHHPVIANPDVCDLLPKLAWHFDEPFADASAVPTYYVSAAARERVTVALSGDGGDELWAGYARHHIEHWESRLRRWLGPYGSRAAGAVGTLLPYAVKGARALGHLALSPADACARKHAYAIFEGREKHGLYTSGFAAQTRDSDPFAPFRAAYNACGSLDPLDRALYVDVKTYMVDDILVKVDRMSMAVSLETREPLLDHKLLEFVARVPSSLKLHGTTRKYLLRRILERRVPPSILMRGKKGFESPTGEWLKGPLADMTQSLLLDGRLKDRGSLRNAHDPAAVGGPSRRPPRSSRAAVDAGDARTLVP